MNNVLSRRTPYDDEYGTCLETRVELRIYPGDISPHEITKRIEIDPSQINVAGEERVNRIGRKRTVMVNGWFLSSEKQVESRDARRHLDWLLQHLLPRCENIAQIQQIPGVRMSVNCVWYSRSGHGGPTLWPEQMKALADLNLECSFDIYFLPDDD
ncbi:DUF4279 domain-containing protein [Sorangium sp. So ce1000]|uniref:DUF4279 domain-containing protein n=1 Tax=Sorangium sp. So ce1000 TaxID=3133325 RepID=UPI003F62F287